MHGVAAQRSVASRTTAPRSAAVASWWNSSSVRPMTSSTRAGSSSPSTGRVIDVLAVAQHRHGLRELEDLVEVVGDEEDGEAGRAHAVDQLVEALGLGGRAGWPWARRGRAAGAAPEVAERAGDGDGGALAHRERRDRAADVEVVAQGDRCASCARLRSSAPADARPCSAGSPCRARGCRPCRGCPTRPRSWCTKRRPGLARRAVAERERVAVDLGGPAVVGLVEAGEDLDQRRLAGAVLADERADLAGLDREADVVERPLATERLRHVGHREGGSHAASWGAAVGHRRARNRWSSRCGERCRSGYFPKAMHSYCEGPI